MVLVVTLLTPECVQRSERRGELVTLMELARKAESQEAIEKAFVEMRPLYLTLNKLNSQRWLVATPVEHLSNNWLLYLDFAGGQLVAMRIRTIDGWWDHPKEAPADFGTPPKDEEQFWTR